MLRSDLHEELIVAGFGGQGVLLAGKLLAYTAMEKGLQVTYMPSYGPEVRGGTAKSMVVIASDPVACPVVNRPDALIVMNQASLDKYAPNLKPGGLLIMNSSKIKNPPDRDDIEIVKVPMDDIALELNAPKCANMAAIGAYLAKRMILTPDDAGNSLKKVLPPRHHKTIPANQQAIRNGADFKPSK